MKGFWLNQAFNDLRHAENREAYRADREAYLSRYPLTEGEEQLVRDGDWAGLIDAGASIYTMTKLGATIDVSLLHMGAQMRGQSFEEFQDFVREQNERNASFALLPGGEGEGDHG